MKIVIIVFVLAQFANGQSLPEWQKLIPLISTRQDVEKLLGKPKPITDDQSIYTTKTGKFIAYFSAVRCEDRSGDKRTAWNVEPNRLLYLLVMVRSPKPPVSFVDNLSSFKRDTADLHDMSGLSYTSPDESLIITTVVRPGGSEKVLTLMLQPSKDQRNLLCEPVK